jgi:hypothetical protein
MLLPATAYEPFRIVTTHNVRWVDAADLQGMGRRTPPKRIVRLLAYPFGLTQMMSRMEVLQPI